MANIISTKEDFSLVLNKILDETGEGDFFIDFWGLNHVITVSYKKKELSVYYPNLDDIPIISEVEGAAHELYEAFNDI